MCRYFVILTPFSNSVYKGFVELCSSLTQQYQHTFNIDLRCVQDISSIKEKNIFTTNKNEDEKQGNGNIPLRALISCRIFPQK